MIPMTLNVEILEVRALALRTETAQASIHVHLRYAALGEMLRMRIGDSVNL